ncbi:MAG: hypothetical protein AAGA93_02815 [Actinomycetota bacterium]
MTDQTMKLYPRIDPRLAPDHYVVTAEQEVVDDGAAGDPSLPPSAAIGDFPDREFHVDVTGPRFSMPGTEVFGVFPPPNSTGPFAGRLAQIVLKRRTLPWERSGGSSGPPWLALVVLAETEAAFLSNVRADFAYTPGRVPSGLPAGATGNCIEVSRTVVDRAFPAEAELDLLAHVRQVDTSASEYADDDGWVSVALSNRLPLPGLKYGAYLISLEGQLDVLPAPGAVADDVPLTFAYADLFASVDDVPRLVFAGREGPTRTTAPIDTLPDVGPADRRRFVVDGDGRVTTRLPESTAAAATIGISQGFVRHDVDFRAIEEAVDLPPEPKFRFPVLAYWNFECSEVAGDFRGYMANLDVGLLGTATPPRDDPRAPVPVTAPTGHVEVAHVDRRGRQARSWYRGPFAPSKVTRRPGDRVFHIADQAIKVVAERRLDISEASAFEIGRLLAMSDTQFLRDIRAWVRQRHTEGWVDRLVVPEHERFAPDLGRVRDLERQLVIRSLVPDGIGGDPLEELGTILPRHEAEELLDDADIEAIAVGLGLSTSLVADVLADGLTSRAVPAPVTGRPTRSFDQVRRDGINPEVARRLVDGVTTRAAFVEAVENQLGGPVDGEALARIIAGDIDLVSGPGLRDRRRFRSFDATVEPDDTADGPDRDRDDEEEDR